MRFQLMLMAAVVTIGACRNAGPTISSGNDTTADRIPASQIVLAERSYENYAWGYQHNGIVINADGSLSGFSWDRGEQPWVHPEGSTISIDELSAKHSHNRRQLGTIGADTVATIQRLLSAAARGTMSAREQIGADAGQNVRSGYVLDERTKVYTRVMLRETGDFSSHNTAPEAAELADLIDAIADRYH